MFRVVVFLYYMCVLVGCYLAGDEIRTYVHVESFAEHNEHTTNRPAQELATRTRQKTRDSLGAGSKK